jgi:hypothetical protein
MSTMTDSTNPGAPTDILEMRAAEQRRRIHDSVLELREQIDEKMDIKKKAAEYVLPASGAAAFLALLFGYGFASMFSRPR